MSSNSELTPGEPFTNNPVIPSSIVSHGPPESHAITGLPATIDSSGVIPKCSLTGVYNSAIASLRRAYFVSSLIDVKNNVSPLTFSDFANLNIQFMKTKG